MADAAGAQTGDFRTRSAILMPVVETRIVRSTQG
jgi:hypothetical protein